MAIHRDKKKELLAQAKQIVDNSKSVVFVEAKGMEVNDSNLMRREMLTEGVGYKVIKKTLINKALAESSVEGDAPSAPGELALAYGDDLVAPARLVRSFEKKHQDNLSIVGGIFDGVFMDKAKMTEIADIPPMDILRGMFVNIINTPIQQFASVIDQVAKKKEGTA